MKRIIALLLAFVMIITAQLGSLTVFAQDKTVGESNAAFSLEIERPHTESQTNISSLYAGDVIRVSIYLTNDYEISSIGIPLVYSTSVFLPIEGSADFNTENDFINNAKTFCDASSHSSGYPSSYTSTQKSTYDYVDFTFETKPETNYPAMEEKTRLVSFDFEVLQDAALGSAVIMIDKAWQKTESEKNGLLFVDGIYGENEATYGQTFTVTSAKKSFTVYTKTVADYTALNEALKKARYYRYNTCMYTDGGTAFDNIVKKIHFNLPTRDQADIDSWTTELTTLLNSSKNGSKYFKFVDNGSYIVQSPLNTTQTIKSTSSSYKLKINSITAYIVNDGVYATCGYKAGDIVTSSGYTFTVKGGSVSGGSPIRYTINYDLLTSGNRVIAEGAIGYGYNYSSTTEPLTGKSGSTLTNPKNGKNRTSSGFSLYGRYVQTTYTMGTVTLTCGLATSSGDPLKVTIDGTKPSSFTCKNLQWDGGGHPLEHSITVSDVVKFTAPSTSGYWSFTYKLSNSDYNYSLPIEIYYRKPASVTNLKNKVNEYLALNLDQNHFTTTSWNKYISALDKAVYYSRAVEAPNAAFKAACQNADSYLSTLNSAFNSLVLRANYDDLDSIIATAEDIMAGIDVPAAYGSTYTALQTAVTNGKNLSRQYSYSSQSTVDTRVTNISNAIDKLALQMADYSVVDEAISAFEIKVANSEYPYSAETLGNVYSIIESYDKEITVDRQSEVDAIAQSIIDATDALVYVVADYNAVDDAIYAAQAMNSSLYRNFDTVTNAINAVVRNVTLDRQAEVDAMAENILSAIAGLEYADADYTKVYEAIEKYQALDADLFVSLDGVKAAVDSVDYTLTIDRQAEVDAMAQKILDEIANCEYVDADYSAVDKAIARTENLFPSEYYTNYYVVENLISAVVGGLKADEQDRVNKMAEDINSAIDGLILLGADYTCVENALAMVPEDTSIYTEDSLDIMWNCIDSLDFTKTIDKQSEVDLMASELVDIIAELKLRDADYSGVDSAIAAAGAIIREHYVNLTALDKAVADVDRSKNILQQSEVDAMQERILSEIKNLELKKADYTAVENAIKDFEDRINNSEYEFNQETVDAVYSVIESVDYTKDILEQDYVDDIAIQIENAVANIKYADANYTSVEEAIDMANLLDRNLYVDFSPVDEAVSKVEYGYTVDKQTDVENMAQAILDAISSLEMKNADYSSVDQAFEIYNSLNRADYIDFTEVEKAVAAVDKTLKADKQTEVDAMAEAIVSAIRKLELKDADLTELQAAVDNAYRTIDEKFATGYELLEEPLNELYLLIDEAYVYEGVKVDYQPLIDELTLKITEATARLSFKSLIDKENSQDIFFDGQFIYGINEGESIEDFISRIAVIGNGKIEATASRNGFGTGTVITLYEVSGEKLEEYTLFQYGDANGDGWVDMFDVTYLSEYVNTAADLTEIPQVHKALDVNKDGYLDNFDLSVLISVANMETVITADGTIK